jgi:glycine/D-amino acid oxidase-like deaminating enzyme
MMMTVVIIGNGILALTTAYRLLKLAPDCQIKIIGPSDHRGCASLAAAAMFNSFAEIDSGTLANKIERQKFLFNKLSTPLWPLLLEEIESDSGVKLEYGFGTFLINNHASDSLEDENFDAIIAALEEFHEPYQRVSPREIPQYKPAVRMRAARAIYIKGEGWTNPRIFFSALKKILESDSRVTWIDQYCHSLIKVGSRIVRVKLGNGEAASGDVFFLAPGAAFSNIIAASNIEIEFPRIFYGVGCSILLKTDGMTLTNCIRTPNRGLACGIYSAPQDPHHTLVGASNFISPVPKDNVRLTSVHTLIKAAMEQINSDYYRSGLVKVNVGWRPTSEDTIALLGKTSIANLIVATGTKRDGFHCSPVISNAMAAFISGRNPDFDLTLFNPERSPVRMYTREEAIEIAVRHTINAAYQHDFVPAKNRMTEHLENYYRDDLSKVHDAAGAVDWGIPPEMIDMYRYGHVTRS